MYKTTGFPTDDYVKDFSRQASSLYEACVDYFFSILTFTIVLRLIYIVITALHMFCITFLHNSTAAKSYD